jgi:hypothetical protein
VCNASLEVALHPLFLVLRDRREDEAAWYRRDPSLTRESPSLPGSPLSWFIVYKPHEGPGARGKLREGWRLEKAGDWRPATGGRSRRGSRKSQDRSAGILGV